MKLLGTIVIVVAVAGLAVGGYFVFKSREQGRNSSGNANLPITNETTPTATPAIVRGDIPIGKSVVFRGTTVAVDTALRTSAFRREQAGQGTEFVVLFLKPFTVDPPTDPTTWAASQVWLTGSDGLQVSPNEVSISTRASTTGGYFWFIVPKGARDLSLQFGRPVEASLALGL